MNIMLIPPNCNMLNFYFCNFKCILSCMLQLTIEISSIIMKSIVGQMFIIELDLLTMASLSMDKPNKEWIVVPPTNNVAFALYATMRSFCSFFVFIKKSWMALMICVFFVIATPLTYCNICLMELLCVNDLNAKICNLFKLYFFNEIFNQGGWVDNFINRFYIFYIGTCIVWLINFNGGHVS